jgi:peptidoglycan hydrolase-like protein with peptidoglycan-binding domain
MKNLVVVALSAGLLAGCAASSEPSPSPTPPPVGYTVENPGGDYHATPVHHPVVHPHPAVKGTDGMKSLQHALAVHPNHYYKGKEDGVDGPVTKAAVSQYQKDLGVEPTGKADEKTWSSLGLSEGN